VQEDLFRFVVCIVFFYAFLQSSRMKSRPTKKRAADKKRADEEGEEKAAKSAPSKKAPKTEPEKDEAKTVKTPYVVWQESLKAMEESINAVGSIVIVGANNPEEDDEEEEEKEKEPKPITQEMMDRVRVVIITPQRKAAMDEARTQILGDEADANFMMFSTSFSYGVEYFLESSLRRIAAQKNLPKKLDLLFGVTFALREFDYWIGDHESGWGGESLVMSEFAFLLCFFFFFCKRLNLFEELGNQWKALLKQSNEKLGLEAFSRAGIEAMLAKLKAQLDYAVAEQMFDEDFDFQYA
jgi:hypothetical protein